MENLDMNMTLAEAVAKEEANLKPESAPKEESTHEPEIQEAAEASSEETTEPADTAESHSEADSEDTGKLEPWMGRRLARAKGQLERERVQNEMLRQQAEMLARQLQQYGAQTSNQPIQNQTEQAQQPITEDHLMQLVERGIQKRQQQQQVAQQAAQQAAFRDKLEKGYDKFDDFDVVFNNSLPLTPVMLDAIVDIQDPDTFLYSVAKNQSKRLAEIARLTPVQQIREMGALVNEHKQKSKPKVVSKAPAPVASKLKTNSGSTAKKDPQDMSLEDFMEFSRNSRRR